jgi:tRNA (adenine58-N1)-methyltransferase non-catalytic subunit
MFDYQLLLSHHFITGEGRLLTICGVDSPPAYPVMTQMNFKKDVFASALSSLNWATVQEDYTPGKLDHMTLSTHLQSSCAVMAPTEPPDGQFHSERQKSRLNKRKAVTDSLTNTREELFAGEFDRYCIHGTNRISPTHLLQFNRCERV